ncbi:MAG TPA: VOC family protein [Roseiflexaceae bacterium]|nr:VOC family protein [Roseiflexaceae bacterium]HMP41843.1 VOC family protein [Roseiflexaceae bacterium]
MAGINGILETALYVDDPQHSAAFYQGLFNCASVAVSDRLIALAVVPGQVLLLFKKRASLALGPTAHDGDGQLHIAFAIAAEDLDAWRIQLHNSGIAVIEDRVWELGGRSLFFRDPDGHLVELGTPGIWANY